MMNEPILFVILIFTAVVVYIMYNLLRANGPKGVLNIVIGKTVPRKEVVGIMMRPDETAVIRHLISTEKTVRIFLRYDIEYRWDSEVYSDDEAAYGVVIKGNVAMPGLNTREIVMGFGAFIPRDVTSFTGVSYRTRFSRVGDRCRYRATVPLRIIEKCIPGSEVTVTAAASVSTVTINSELRLFLTR